MNYKNVSGIVWGIIAFLIVCGGVYVNFDVFRPTFSTVKPAIEEDTSTWKTYTNEKYGFEFKYPASWILSVHKDLSGVSLYPSYLFPQGYSGDGAFFGVGFDNRTLQEIEKEFDTAISSGNTALKSNIDVNTIPAIKYTDGEFSYVFFFFKGKTYYINTRTTKEAPESSKILSTFKFTNVKSVDNVVAQTGDIKAIQDLLTKQSWVDIIVMAKDNASADAVLVTLTQGDFKIKDRNNSIFGFSGSISKTGMDKLIADHRVTAIELDQVVTTQTLQVESGISGTLMNYTCNLPQPDCPPPHSIPFAKISIENIATNDTLTITTDKDGNFKVNVAPGEYLIINNSPIKYDDGKVTVVKGKYTKIESKYGLMVP